MGLKINQKSIPKRLRKNIEKYVEIRENTNKYETQWCVRPGQQAGGTESAIYEKLDVILLHLTCALSQVCRVLAVALAAAALAALLVALLTC